MTSTQNSQQSHRGSPQVDWSRQPHSAQAQNAMPDPYAMPYPAARKKAKLGWLAWSGLILSTVGIAGSIIPFVNYLTACVAVVGGMLGIVALFGSRKIVAAISIALCILAVACTVLEQRAFWRDVHQLRASTERAQDTTADIHEFGQTVTLHGGSTLLVAEPVEFTPGADASTAEASRLYLTFKVTFVNKSAEPYDPSLTTVSASAGGETGESVDRDGPAKPGSQVEPGESASWWVRYGVKNRTDLKLSVGLPGYAAVTYAS